MSHGHQVVRFADESSTMLKSVADIFGQYIERAKTFLESLKGSQTQTPGSPSSDTTMSSPPPFGDNGSDQMMTTPPASPKSS